MILNAKFTKLFDITMKLLIFINNLTCTILRYFLINNPQLRNTFLLK